MARAKVGQVELALLRAVAGGGGWEDAGREPVECEPGRPLAVRVANSGAAAVHVLVLARGPDGLRKLSARIVAIASGAEAFVGRTGGLVLRRGEDGVAVVVSADRAVVAAVADAVRAGAEVRLGTRSKGWTARTFRVRPAMVAASMSRPPKIPPTGLAPGGLREAFADRTCSGFSEVLADRPRNGFSEVLADLPPTGIGAGGGGGSGRSARRASARRPAKAAPRSAAKPARKAARKPAKPAAKAPATRSAYGRLDAPDAVVAGAEFAVVVGIAEELSPGAVGGAMAIPDEKSVGPYTIEALVVAPGCRLRDGEAWRNDLRVTKRAPSPFVTLHLTSEAFAGGVGARTIQVLYAIRGATVGLAVRSVAVVAKGAALPSASAPAAQAFFDSLPVGYPVPDLTIRILTDPKLDDGTLFWDVVSPHPSVPRPPESVPTNIGGEPREFAKNLMQDVNANEGGPGLPATLGGYADVVAEEIPTPVLDALRAAAAVAQAKKRVPTVLLLSAEPYVPWELARVDPPLDPAAPPFLGAQVAFGRWVLGNRKPAKAPPVRVGVKAMAVVNGVYDMPNWERLVHAEEEAAAIAKEYGAAPVPADLPSVLALLRGDPEAQVLHFALHGKYDPNGKDDGLKLVDRGVLAPVMVRDATLGAAPFVYLNACQVGSGNAVLGDYAGLAAAFVHAGAAAVVAPLWKIDDALARDVALRLYAALFSGTTVGEALRRERAAFADSPNPTSATLLAYQFFGHPTMTLEKV